MSAFSFSPARSLPRSQRINRTVLYRAYYVLMVALALFLLIRGTPSIPHIPWPAVVMWVGLMCVTEMAPIRLPKGGIITVSSVLDYAALVVFGPFLTAWIDIFSMIVHRGVSRERRPVHKVIFNMALYVVTAIAAGAMFRLTGGEVGSLRIPENLPAFVVMGLTYFGLNTMGVSLVIALETGESPGRVWSDNFRWTMVHLLGLVPFGCMVALLYLQLGYVAVLLFMFPVLLARYSFKLYTEIRTDFLGFVDTLTRVVEQVDPYTRDHSYRVSVYAEQIAREMGLPPSEIDTIVTAARLHDLGKVSFRTLDIIESPSRLTSEQRNRMTRHPIIGAEIVSSVRMLGEASEIVRCHHERMDGTGYPSGLSGDQIPLGARIVMAADSLDAMTSDRSYRRALTLEVAMAELRRQSDRQFDPEVVAAVERLHQRKELKALYDARPLISPGSGSGSDDLASR